MRSERRLTKLRVNLPDGTLLCHAESDPAPPADERQVDVPLVTIEDLKDSVFPSLDVNCVAEWTHKGVRLTFPSKSAAVRFRLKYPYETC